MMDCTSQKRATDLWVRPLRRDWLRSCPRRLLRAVKLQGPGKERKEKGAGRDKEKRKPQSREEARLHRGSCDMVSVVSVTDAF